MQILNDYISWSATRWFSPHAPDLAGDLCPRMVMALGLAGECGEVAEVVEAWALTSVCDQTELRKELGDVIYYWAMLCHSFGWQASAGAPSPMLPLTAVTSAPLLAHLTLAKTIGAVCECVKKYARDGTLDGRKFALAMAAVLPAWIALCSASGLDWREVLAANRVKVDGRHSRGTMRGSGNDR